MNKKKFILIVIVSLVALAVIIKIINSFSNSKESSAKESDLGIPIELEAVIKGDLTETINYIGTIEAKKSATLSPTIAGQIVHVFVAEGSIVKYGDVLVKIDDSQLEASMDTAQKKLDTLSTNYIYLENEVNDFYTSNPLIKQLETAQSNYDYLKSEYSSYKDLYEEGAIPKSTLDKMQQELNNAYLKTEELKANIRKSYDNLVHEKSISAKQIEELNSSINELNVKIEDTIIKAPLNGVVKMIEGNVGDLAVVGKPLVSIDDNKEWIIKVNVSENDINKIFVGSEAVLKINGLEGEIDTQVSKIVPNVNSKTRIGLIELGPIKNEKSSMLFSGNSAEVKIITNEAQNKLIIPKNSIKSLNNKDIVYLYMDGIVKETEIITGITVGDNTEVISGLKEGDKIAASNLSKIYDNASVYVFRGEE
ncbi:efflux RND transporter periplasmic adaptor subunit [Sedimentibacter sp.]|uniref:efflux RND transporter periplasmic adaptor subunit n=1 Tax=Sedimentibacter sp. TaxID=1960295 RepID=UPI0028B0F263|nr:efflux RND transporter periplasmic adaptor subunit [Sedimentibacter sp.]